MTVSARIELIVPLPCSVDRTAVTSRCSPLDRRSSSWAEPYPPEVQLPDPQLAEQRSILRVVLVVADPLRDEIRPGPVVQRNQQGPIGDFAVELGPEAVRPGAIRLLDLYRSL